MKYNILDFDKHVKLSLTEEEKNEFIKYANFLRQYFDKKVSHIFKQYLENNYNLIIKCPVCNVEFRYNGYSSHSKVHSEIKLKVNEIFNECFEGFTCVVCGKKIKLKYNKDRKKNPYFCSSRCATAAHRFVHRVNLIRKCAVCNNYIFNVVKGIKTCSEYI